MTPLTLIGVAGGSASGKSALVTTLVAKLAAGAPDGLGAQVLAHDAYYRSAPLEGPLPNFDHPDALETTLLVAHLDALRAGHPVRPPVYDFTTHQRRTDVTGPPVQPRGRVFVEGLLVLSVPELRARLDHRIFVDAPFDARLARRVARDQAERGRAADDIVRQVRTTVEPMHQRFVEPARQHADLVLDGTLPLAGLADRLLTHLRRNG